MALVKTKDEIKIMREAGRRLALVMDEVEKYIKPGITTGELDDTAKKLIEKGGDVASFLHYTPEGANRPYPAALCVSVNDEVVHGIPESLVIKEGDVVSIDLGLKHKNFHGDMARTVSVGETSIDTKRLIEVTKYALAEGIKFAKAGNTAGHIGNVIEEIVKKEGFSIVKELGGHGIGRKVHEDPFIPNFGRPGEGAKLLEGMVIAIEPIISMGRGDIFLSDDGYTFKTKDRSTSAHFEHTVLVTKKGGDILTK